MLPGANQFLFARAAQAAAGTPGTGKATARDPRAIARSRALSFGGRLGEPERALRETAGSEQGWQGRRLLILGQVVLTMHDARLREAPPEHRSADATGPSRRRGFDPVQRRHTPPMLHRYRGVSSRLVRHNRYSTAEVRQNITAVFRPSMEQSTLMCHATKQVATDRQSWCHTAPLWGRAMTVLPPDHAHRYVWSIRPKKRSNDGAAVHAIWAATDPSTALPTKRLTSRHENRASTIGWLSRTSPPACGTIRSIVDASHA